MKTHHWLIIGGVAVLAYWYFFIRTSASAAPAPATN